MTIKTWQDRMKDGGYVNHTAMLTEITELRAALVSRIPNSEEVMHQVWHSTDSCGEFYSWDDVDESEYNRFPESGRRILYLHPAPSAKQTQQWRREVRNSLTGLT